MAASTRDWPGVSPSRWGSRRQVGPAAREPGPLAPADPVDDPREGLARERVPLQRQAGQRHPERVDVRARAKPGRLVQEFRRHERESPPDGLGALDGGHLLHGCRGRGEGGQRLGGVAGPVVRDRRDHAIDQRGQPGGEVGATARKLGPLARADPVLGHAQHRDTEVPEHADAELVGHCSCPLRPYFRQP
jgi:hypothetical protein